MLLSNLSVDSATAQGVAYFEYGEDAVEHLKSKDKVLAPVIEQIGHVYRPMDGDLFESVMRSIIGQQVSTAAQKP